MARVVVPGGVMVGLISDEKPKTRKPKEPKAPEKPKESKAPEKPKSENE